MLALQADPGETLPEASWQGLVDEWLDENPPGRRVLLLPPDQTRGASCAGEISAYLYQKLQDREVYLMPAVGSHLQMTGEELASFFPGIPSGAFLTHNWETDCETAGVIPDAFIRQISDGRVQGDLSVPVDHRILDGSFDTIISLGQVVPHEVAGMSNYTKNLVIGEGGPELINQSHMIGALYGVEKTMGNVDTPVRALFDYAQDHFLDACGVTYFLTVTTQDAGEASLRGLFIGQKRDAFEAAAACAQKWNITYLEKRVPKIAAWLAPEEFKSFWVGNKGIYRTRMAIEDGGELVLLAPGIRTCGEQPAIDALIRQYGYCGTQKVLDLYRAGSFDGMEMVAAHLIHGSTEGRFQVTYATDPALMSREEVEQLGFQWMDIKEAVARYRPRERETGFVTEGDDAYYFIQSPALGLWRTRK